MKKLVYTAIFNDYDQLRPVDRDWNCDFVCLTDNPNMKSNGWIIRIIDENFVSYKSANRKFKILTHQYFPDYESSLYVDGNVRIKKDPSPLFDKYLEMSNFASCIHFSRDCVYSEARALLLSGRLNDEEKVKMLRQVGFYIKNSYPRHCCLIETNILFRNHMNPSVVRLMEMWWSELSSGSHRDQISLPYSLWKSNVTIQYIDEAPRFDDSIFAVELHRNGRKSWIKRCSYHIVYKLKMREKNNFFAFLLLKMIEIFVFIKHSTFKVSR